MKKVLFATTALVAFAGAAAADVTLTGSAEMGIVGGSSSAPAPGNDVPTTFFQSVDVRFAMTGETDNGLQFGATVDLEDSTDAADIVDISGTFADFTVFVAGDFGRLTMGDTDGALDWAVTDAGNLGNPGSIADDETGHAGYNGNGVFDGFGAFNNQVLRYEYSVGGFGVAVSAEVAEGAVGGDINESTNYGIGFRYSGDFGGGSYQFGLGYQTADDLNDLAAVDTGYSAIGVSAQVSLDAGLAAVVNYTQIDTDVVNGDGEHIGVGLSYTIDAISLHANWGEYDWEAGAAFADASGFGLAAAYDFGGGLTANIGYGDSNIGALNAAAATFDRSSWSLGLRMAF